MTPERKAPFTYTPWPEGGCTLQEALMRTSDPIQWSAFTIAETQLAAVAGPRDGPLSDVGHPGGESQKLSDERAQRQLLHSANSALQTLTTRFCEHVVQGALVATGKTHRSSKSRSVMLAQAWTNIKVKQWDQSIAEEGSKPTVWYGVRIFPLLVAPNASGTLSGMTFRDAFRRFVFEDPEVRSLVKAAPRTDLRAIPLLEEGKFPHQHGNEEDHWPIAIEQYKDLAKVLNDNKYGFERTITVSANSQACWDAFLHRYRRLLHLCEQGGVRGTTAATGATLDINSAEFSRPSSWIDVRNGDLLDKTRDGKFEVLWRGLSFFHVKPTTYDEARSATIEPKRKLKKKSASRAEAGEAYQSCLSWLVQIMRSNPNERPEIKESFWIRAQKKWPALSERAFLRAWDNAVSESGATVWSAPGAPKKKGR